MFIVHIDWVCYLNSQGECLKHSFGSSLKDFKNTRMHSITSHQIACDEKVEIFFEVGMVRE